MEDKQDNQQSNPTNPLEPVVIKPQVHGVLEISHETTPKPDTTQIQDNNQISTQEHATTAENAPQPNFSAPEEIEEQKTNDIPSNQTESETKDNQINNEWQYQSGKLNPSTGIGESNSTGSNDESLNKTIEDMEVKWSASEFVSHEKTTNWYILLTIIVVLIAAIIYFVTKDIFSTVVVGLVAIIVGAYGALKPRVLEYVVNNSGIQIGSKQFPFEDFQSFSILDDSALPGIQLLPQKRFMLPITMYFAPKDGDKIIAILSDYLPYEPKKLDVIEKISTRIHF